jgi:hypothetical protein
MVGVFEFNSKTQCFMIRQDPTEMVLKQTWRLPAIDRQFRKANSHGETLRLLLNYSGLAFGISFGGGIFGQPFGHSVITCT